VIERSRTLPGLVHVAAIRSTGLSVSLAIGEHVDAVAEVLKHTGGREIVAAGLDHRGESVLAWDARRGRALTPVVVWQDKRQHALLTELRGPLADICPSRALASSLCLPDREAFCSTLQRPEAREECRPT
jgi:hypothetical protein